MKLLVISPLLLALLITAGHSQYSVTTVRNYAHIEYLFDIPQQIDRQNFPPQPEWTDPRITSTEGRKQIVREAFLKVLHYICQCRDEVVLGTGLQITQWTNDNIGCGGLPVKSDHYPVLYPIDCDKWKYFPPYSSVAETCGGFPMLVPYAFDNGDDIGFMIRCVHLNFSDHSLPAYFYPIRIRYSKVQRKANCASRSFVDGFHEERPPGAYLVMEGEGIGTFPQDIFPDFDLPPPSKVLYGQLMRVGNLEDWERYIYSHSRPQRHFSTLTQASVTTQEFFTIDIEIFPLIFDRKELVIPSEIGLDYPWARDPVEATTLVILHELAHLEQYILDNAKTAEYRQQKPLAEGEDAAWAFASSLIRCK